jgi:hypothetical protein
MSRTITCGRLSRSQFPLPCRLLGRDLAENVPPATVSEQSLSRIGHEVEALFRRDDHVHSSLVDRVGGSRVDAAFSVGGGELLQSKPEMWTTALASHGLFLEATRTPGATRSLG